MSMLTPPTKQNVKELMQHKSTMSETTRMGDLNIAPLMVYPLGAAAAATAVGFGLVGQMSGLMMGAMQGALKSQAMMLGANPDRLWMVPVLKQDGAGADKREAGESKSEAVEQNVETVSKTAEIVALKPAAKSASAGKAKTGQKTTLAVEKIKSDANSTAQSAPKAKSASRSATPKAAKAEGALGRPKAIDKPQAPDDLKQISGVGPKLEQVLNEIGIWTFEQIASWQPEESVWVDTYLQLRGRIERDNWISQAETLAKGPINGNAGTE